jgi:hypothetical protein
VSEGPVRIFVFGIIGLIALFSFMLNLHFVLFAFCIGAVGWAVDGFFLRSTQQFSVAWLPEADPGAEILRPTILGGQDITCEYPQALVLRTRLRNLPFLLSCVALLAVCAWYLWNRPRSREALDQELWAIWYFTQFGWMFLGMVVYKWWSERRILKLRTPVLAFIWVRPNFVQYEFFDSRGERYAGGYKFSGDVPQIIDNVTVVYFDPVDPNKHVSAFGFWFHRLELVDRFHAPKGQGSAG